MRFDYQARHEVSALNQNKLDKLSTNFSWIFRKFFENFSRIFREFFTKHFWICGLIFTQKSREKEEENNLIALAVQVFFVRILVRVVSVIHSASKYLKKCSNFFYPHVCQKIPSFVPSNNKQIKIQMRLKIQTKLSKF